MIDSSLIDKIWPMLNPLICDKCKSEIIRTDVHALVCHIEFFRKFEAPKYGMVSVIDMLNPEYDFNYVAGNLKNVYPKVASKILTAKCADSRLYDIFIESWGAEAVRQYIKNGGFAGMSLAEFLDKVATERHGTPTIS